MGFTLFLLVMIEHEIFITRGEANKNPTSTLHTMYLMQFFIIYKPYNFNLHQLKTMLDGRNDRYRYYTVQIQVRPPPRMHIFFKIIMIWVKCFVWSRIGNTIRPLDNPIIIVNVQHFINTWASKSVILLNLRRKMRNLATHVRLWAAILNSIFTNRRQPLNWIQRMHHHIEIFSANFPLRYSNQVFPSTFLTLSAVFFTDCQEIHKFDKLPSRNMILL